MKKIELVWPAEIVCPFCEQHIQSIDDGEISDFNPCEHTIFVAHDEGFEFRTPIINELLNLDPDEDNAYLDIDIDDDVCGFDGLTDALEIEGSVKIAAYSDDTRPEGIYFGFKPNS